MLTFRERLWDWIVGSWDPNEYERGQDVDLKEIREWLDWTEKQAYERGIEVAAREIELGTHMQTCDIGRNGSCCCIAYRIRSLKEDILKCNYQKVICNSFGEAEGFDNCCDRILGHKGSHRHE